MFNVDNFDIYISKGNTASFKANLQEDGEPYELKSGDVLVLNASKDGGSVFQLTADREGVFTFTAETTAELDAGDYEYDLKLTTEGGDECNPIPLSALTILRVSPEPQEPEPQSGEK